MQISPMGVNQILDQVKQLTYLEQLTVAEAILRSILEREKESPLPGISDEKLSAAAEALQEDYENDADLTFFAQFDRTASPDHM